MILTERGLETMANIVGDAIFDGHKLQWNLICAAQYWTGIF